MKDARQQKTRRGESGQSFVELSLVLIIMTGLVFGMVDFCRAIFMRQVITNLTREAANLAARGTGVTTLDIMSNAVDTIVGSASPLNLTTTNALFVLTAVTNNNSGGAGSTFIRYQIVTGTLAATNAVGRGVGSAAKLPLVTPALSQPRHTVYIAEIYYKYYPITPVGKWFSPSSKPFIIRDAAYFPGG